MAKEVIGTCPSTGEVLVRDTETGDMSWEAGTEEQIESVTEDIEAAGDYGAVEYQEYEPPPAPVPEPKPVPPEEQVVYVAPTTLEELDILALAETTGGYPGIEALDWIIERLNWLSEYFYDIYLEVNSWMAPFNYAAYLFYFASAMFSQLAWGFYDFSEWVYDTANKVKSILNWDTIWSYILSYIPNLEAIRDWFYDRWSWFTTQTANWWSETSTTVIGWIDAAKDWAWLWIDYLQTQANALSVRVNEAIALIPDVTELQAWYSNWWGNILGMLNSWWNERLLDVQSLIDSAFLIRDDFWRGWQDWRDKVAEFFTDPEEWLYRAVDRIIERYW